MYERVALVMIAAMAIMGLGFVQYPMEGIQFRAFLIDGECYLAERRWMVLMQAFGDTVLSVLLLSLFIIPLRNIELLPRMRSIVRKNRNLIFFAIFFNLGVVFTIISLSKPKMQTVIFLCVVDRLVTLQCITMTFSYDLSYFKFKFCSVFHRKSVQEIDNDWISASEPDFCIRSYSIKSASDSTCSTESTYDLRTISL